MSDSLKSHLSPLFFLVLYFSIAVLSASAADFVNPVMKNADVGCTPNNLLADRFGAEVSADERIRMCRAVDKITAKLNADRWSPELSAELSAVWRVFSSETIQLRRMPNGSPSRMLAMAEPFPSGAAVGANFEACVYLRPSESGDRTFFQVLLHELRHVYDFYETWKNRETVGSLEIERRAFLLMSRLAQETGESASGVPKFWKDSWQKLPAAQASFKRGEAVDKYLRDNKFYRSLAADNAANRLDFSRFQAASAKTDVWQFAPASYDKKDTGRLPNRAALPKTDALIAQKVRETEFNLEKPKNMSDEKEILRVALRNEKKLYYGMQNFVYDQKLAFQCWQKGKISASVSESETIARTANGSALTKASSTATPAAATPCALDSRNLKTDFAETFWASPALEKMPIVFAGFVEDGGERLARYTVLQPNSKLFAELSKEYDFIQPFRVFVGTIYVSPKDGQIVKFWGTSFPEDTVTGSRSEKVWGSYSVTAVRQKLNIERGLWVTVYIGTVAVANIKGSSRPFSYTVNFENYRQSTTDVRIFDDEAMENVSSAVSLVGSK